MDYSANRENNHPPLLHRGIVVFLNFPNKDTMICDISFRRM